MRKISFLVLTIVMLMASLPAKGQGVTKKQDWAQFYVFEKDNARIAAQKEGKCPNCRNKSSIKAVLMGDSITETWWGKDSTFFKDNNFVGRGISGQTTSEMIVRFRKDVLDLHPQFVVIMAGTNDIAQNNGIISKENILGNLKTMVEIAKFHNINPMLCSVPPSAGFVWRKDLAPAKEIIELNKMIKEYAVSVGIPYIDYHSALTDENGGMPKEYAKDGVHPTLEGFKIMEKILLETFEKKDFAMDNVVLSSLKTRRSIRSYKKQQIKDEELLAVLQAGTFAPNGMGIQDSWIVAVQNEDIKKELIRMNAEILGTNSDPYYGAPTIILVFGSDPQKWRNSVQDGSLVLGNMMNAAHSLGLGTCWINREMEMFATDEGKALMRKMGIDEKLIKEGLTGIGALAIGYPEGEPRAPKPRKENYYRIIK